MSKLQCEYQQAQVTTQKKREKWRKAVEKLRLAENYDTKCRKEYDQAFEAEVSALRAIEFREIIERVAAENPGSGAAYLLHREISS